MDKTILHIEDNFENRLLVRRILVAEGYNVLEAENASESIDILSTITPDLILMDINMPDIDGYTLTSRLKANPAYQAIPILAITANVTAAARERSQVAGFNGYIEKPIDIDNFLEKISHYLA
jgi:two-component system cell cycle response regulator DivK